MDNDNYVNQEEFVEATAAKIMGVGQPKDMACFVLCSKEQLPSLMMSVMRSAETTRREK